MTLRVHLHIMNAYIYDYGHLEGEGGARLQTI